MKINNEAKVILLADSISDDGTRLTTFELTFWRPILPQILTHREFSRCTQSNRAKPIEKLIEEVKSSPWFPNKWGINQKGMVAENKFTDPELIKLLQNSWYQVAVGTATVASSFSTMKIHKEIVNRLLEPFSCTRMVLSSTSWDNFLKLRLDKHAQAEINDIAKKIKVHLDENEPDKLKEYEWHLPYISELDMVNCDDPAILPKVSAARCARVSYKAYDGTTSIEADLELYNKLVSSSHYSPLEHVAQINHKGMINSNFKAPWLQLRKLEENGK